MERFQKIRNNRRKFDVSSICRFCGLENEERYNILQLNEDGVDFVTKVSSMLGIKVYGADKMPQNVCFICMDKINDFYEFRLMALNTDKQTRDALGIPIEEEEKPKPVKMQIQTKPAIVKLIDLKHSTKDSFLIQKALQKLNQRNEEQNIPSTSTAVKRENTPVATVTQPPNKKSRKDISCTICRDTYFSYINDLQDHQMKDHLPLIAKYACGSCRETFEQLSDFKAHENMHTVRRLPYVCYICKVRYSKLRDFQRHMLNYNCPRKEKLPVLVEDIKCFQCKKKYLTQNLFEWHGCFLKTRGSCTKCGLSVQKKKALMKHYVLCKAKFVTPEAARDPNANSIKAETISPTRGPVINISTVSSLKSKGVRKKTVPTRRATVFKAEKEVNLSLTNTTITHPEEEEDEYANYEEDITYDNFGSDEDEQITNLEPVVQLQEPHVPRIIDIKAEKSNDFEAVKHLTVSPNNPSNDTQLIRKIKREQSNKQIVVSTNKQKSVPEMRVKTEKSMIEQPIVQVLNPLAVSKLSPETTMTARKKVFKMPQQLAMKIKKEKMHAEYGDSHEMRDEAEPDPEEEAQMEYSLLSPAIKQEKVDSNAVKVTSNPSKPNKKFINPIAMMREKNAKKNLETANNIGGSLVISAVTSMSANESNDDSNVMLKEPASVEISSQTPHEIPNNGNTQNDKLNEINDTEKNTSHECNPVMIEIPAEFTKSSQKNHYSSTVEATNESDNQKLSTIGPSEIVEKNEVTKPVTDNVSETQAINTNEDDELDQLLQKYESNINDGNDLQDSDLQDLLKFD